MPKQIESKSKWFVAVGLCAAAIACSGRRDPAPAGESTGAAANAAPSPARGSALTIKGSDTMVILAQKWAEQYMRANAGTTVQVSGGGSGTGIAALLNRTTDIANSSRPMKAREREQAGGDVREFKVAVDALAIYVHASNPLASLTLAQAKQIFRGQVRNWSELGGRDAPIVLYSRENNSGTYEYFKEHVLDGEDFAVNAQTLSGTSAVINAVSRDPNGIGFGGIAYAAGARPVPLLDAEGRVESPTRENAQTGRYPLARFLYMYTRGAPSADAQRFLDWVRSPEGQSHVEGVGYFPMPASGELGEAAPVPAPTGAPPAPAPAAPTP